MVGEGNGDAEWNELDEGEGPGEGVRNELLDGDGERGIESVEEAGDVGSYTGGGTKLAFTRRLPCLGPPTSSTACKSAAYRSWNVLRILISIPTALRSAAIAGRLGLTGFAMGGRPQTIRARSCWCSGLRA